MNASAKRMLLAIAAAALAGGATMAMEGPGDSSPALEKALAGRIAGKSVDCIDRTRVNGPEIIDPYNILYRQSGARLWRSRLESKCSGLRADDILVVETFGEQLCRNDRMQIVNRNSGAPLSYCFLGGFTPYDKPAPPR